MSCPPHVYLAGIIEFCRKALRDIFTIYHHLSLAIRSLEQVGSQTLRLHYGYRYSLGNKGVNYQSASTNTVKCYIRSVRFVDLNPYGCVAVGASFAVRIARQSSAVQCLRN